MFIFLRQTCTANRLLPRTCGATFGNFEPLFAAILLCTIGRTSTAAETFDVGRTHQSNSSARSSCNFMAAMHAEIRYGFMRASACRVYGVSNSPFVSFSRGCSAQIATQRIDRCILPAYERTKTWPRSFGSILVFGNRQTRGRRQPLYN
jgi:hypothetical protein